MWIIISFVAVTTWPQPQQTESSQSPAIVALTSWSTEPDEVKLPSFHFSIYISNCAWFSSGLEKTTCYHRYYSDLSSLHCRYHVVVHWLFSPSVFLLHRYRCGWSPAWYHLNTSSLSDHTLIPCRCWPSHTPCCSPDCWYTQNSSVHWPGRIHSSDRWCTQDSPVRWYRETTLSSSDRWCTQDSPVRWYRETLLRSSDRWCTQNTSVH